MSLYRQFLLRSEPHVIACIAFIRANWQQVSLSVEVREKGDKRSAEQNRRLHALLNAISEQAWIGGKQYDAETWKEHFRRTFIGVETIDLPDGQRIERGVSTTTLNVGQFAEFMTKVEAYAATELGVML